MKYSKIFNLDGKTAYILGGLGLIGIEIAKIFYEFGAKTIILDNKTKHRNLIKDYINSKKNFMKIEQFDCSKINKLQFNFQKIFNKYGNPNIFINASYPKTSDWHKNNFENIKLESLRKNIDMHLISYVWSSKIIAENMKLNKIKGSIVHLSSIYGQQAQDLNIYKNTKLNENVTYSVIKGGINNYTRQLASYYGKYKIRVNNISPGGIRNPADKKNQNKEFIKNYSKKTLLGRMSNPHEIAAPVLFLSSDASSYVTGETLLVDGGFSAI